DEEGAGVVGGFDVEGGLGLAGGEAVGAADLDPFVGGGVHAAADPGEFVGGVAGLVDGEVDADRSFGAGGEFDPGADGVGDAVVEQGHGVGLDAVPVGGASGDGEAVVAVVAFGVSDRDGRRAPALPRRDRTVLEVIGEDRLDVRHGGRRGDEDVVNEEGAG